MVSLILNDLIFPLIIKFLQDDFHTCILFMALVWDVSNEFSFNTLKFKYYKDNLMKTHQNVDHKITFLLYI